MDFNISNVKLVFCVKDKHYMVNGDAEYPIHACLNKKVIGTLWVTMGAFTEKGVIDREAIHVHSFEVDKEYQHKGVGRKMLKFVKYYYNNKDIYLGVVKKNINAFNFYKKEGFNVVEDCSSFYRMVNRKSI